MSREPARGGQRDVIFAFAYATWRTAVARGMCFSEDRMVQTLLAHPRVGRVLVVETPRSLPLKLVRDRMSPPPAFPSGPRASLYSPVRLRRGDPARTGALERSFGRWGRRLEREAACRGLERPALITTHPLVPGFADLDWVDSLTYYVYDDWAASPPLRRLWPAYEEAYRRTSRRGLRVAAVSRAIIERICPQGPYLEVPNGVDPQEWLAPREAPEWFTELPGPRLLYIGSLDDRIDVGALRGAARAFPGASIALVGPMLAPGHFRELAAEPNVHVREREARGEVVGLVQAADACLLPHLRSPLTEAMSPLKLYEYLSGGAPVAALDLPPIRDIHRRVIISEELPDAIRSALALGRAPQDEQRRFAQAHSWRSRQDRIVELALADPGAQPGPSS